MGKIPEEIQINTKIRKVVTVQHMQQHMNASVMTHDNVTIYNFSCGSVEDTR